MRVVVVRAVINVSRVIFMSCVPGIMIPVRIMLNLVIMMRMLHARADSLSDYLQQSFFLKKIARKMESRRFLRVIMGQRYES